MQFTNIAIRNKMARLLAEKRADLAEDLRHEIEWSANAFHSKVHSIAKMEAFVETQKAHETVRQAENREILREHRDKVEAIAVALLTRDVATELAAVAAYNALKARVRANPSVFYEGHRWMRMGFLSENGEKSAPARYLMLAQGRSMALKAELEADGVLFPPAPEHGSAPEVRYGAGFSMPIPA